MSNDNSGLTGVKLFLAVQVAARGKVGLCKTFAYNSL